MSANTTKRLAIGVATVVVAFLLFAGTSAVTDDGVASAVHENSDSPAWVHEANFTLKFTNPTPGEKTGAVVWASLPQTEAYGDGLEEGKFVQVWLPQAWSGDIESESDTTCSREHVSIAGVDRGSNLSSTKVDESLVSSVKNYWIGQNDAGQTYALLEAYGKDDFGGEHVSAHYSDEAVAKLDDCFTTPNQPGWYRGGFYANGTNYKGEYVEAAGYTYYFYLCDCENRQEAIEKLGKPPVEGTGWEGTIIRADSKGVYGDTLDGGPPETWDLQSLREPESGENQGSATTPTPGSGGNGGEDTPEATATPAPSNGGEDTSEATATPVPETNNGGNNDGGGSSATPNSQDGGNGQMTPTATEGPGFGPLLTLLGLLASSLLLYRRR